MAKRPRIGQKVQYQYISAAVSCQSAGLIKGVGRIRAIDHSNDPHCYDVDGVMVSADEIAATARQQEE
jgi:hypothetical protein